MKMKIVIIALLIFALVGSSLALPGAPSPTVAPSYCDSKCGARCSKAGVKDRCLTYCNICCKKCNCVPSGTYGNKSECPCYRDMVNNKGKSKCPWNRYSLMTPRGIILNQKKVVFFFFFFCSPLSPFKSQEIRSTNRTSENTFFVGV